MSTDNPRLKDIYFSDAFVERLAADVHAAYPRFEPALLIHLVHSPGFAAMSLKAKMRHVTRSLRQVLPADFPAAVPILRQVAPGYPSFDGMVFSDYVGEYGLGHWDLSMAALGDLTRWVSAEFAIRPFLRHDAPRALITMRQWAEDGDPAVRRLASEGSRPRLPWGISLPAFKIDPTPILPILETLKADPDLVVRRSVANNLNDIAKDNPQVTLDLAEAWYGRCPETDWVVKHACRTLLKAGDERALRLFGFADPAQIDVRYLTLRPTRLAIGEALTFSYDLMVKGDTAVPLRLEYAILFQKAHGKQSRKVFHQRERSFAPGHHIIEGQHSFRDLSTRTHYPGVHELAILVNGVVKARAELLLTAAD